MEQSQDYSFNKAHAACYALIAYRTAWLKANHPREYMAALISSVMNTKDRVPFYVNACRRDGHRGAAARRQRVAVRLRRRRGAHPLRPERGQERRRLGGARDHRGARGGRPVRVGLGLHRARRPGGRRTSARSSRWSSAARSTRPARRARACSSASSGALVGRPPPRRPAGRPGLDLRPGRGEEEQAPRHHPVDPAGRVRQARAAAMEKESLGLYVSEHPLQADRRAAAAQDRLRASRRSSGAATARSSPSAG